MGFVQYYSMFIKDFAEITARLNAAKGEKPFRWSPEYQKDLDFLKKSFESCQGRRHLVLDEKSQTYKGLTLDIDFSRHAIAAVLHQSQGGGVEIHWR